MMMMMMMMMMIQTPTNFRLRYQYPWMPSLSPSSSSPLLLWYPELVMVPLVWWLSSASYSRKVRMLTRQRMVISREQRVLVTHTFESCYSCSCCNTCCYCRRHRATNLLPLLCWTAGVVVLLGSDAISCLLLAGIQTLDFVPSTISPALLPSSLLSSFSENEY